MSSEKLGRQLVSVIIPVYKTADYLIDCFQSVFEQTYSNLEIIAVDDGSPDNSYELLREMDDSRLRILRKDNGGLSDARNYGLDNATGELVFFLDSDDILHHRTVELLVEARDRTGSKIVRGFPQSFSEGDKLDLLNLTPYDVTVVRAEEAVGLLYETESLLRSTVAWGKLYDKSLFKDLRFPVGKIHEDVAVALDLLLQVEAVCDVSAPLYFYRNNQNSITNTPGWNHLDALVFYENHFKRLSQLNHPQASNALMAAIKTAINNAADYRQDYRKRSSQRYLRLVKHLHYLAKRIPLTDIDRTADKILVLAIRISPATSVAIYGWAKNLLDK